MCSLPSNVVHKYSHPGSFAVTVDCVGADLHVSAQKIIVIQEPVRMFGVITCYAEKLSFRGTNCTALFGEQFQIQISVNAGRCQDDHDMPIIHPFLYHITAWKHECLVFMLYFLSVCSNLTVSLFYFYFLCVCRFTCDVHNPERWNVVVRFVCC